MMRILARAGFAVHACKRSREKAQRLAAEGAELHDRAADAVRDAMLILTTVSDAAAVLGVMEDDEDAVAGCSEGAIWLQMSMIGLEGTRRCAQLAQAA